MCNETTDVAVKKEVIIYACYLGKDRKVQTSSISMMKVTDGRAITILAAIHQLCQHENIDLDHKLVAFGSDGAAVMIGVRGGVAALLKEVTPWIITNHCVAHWLALASAQAANEVPYVKKFKAILGQLYCFYENSAVRTAGLKEIQEVLNDPNIKLTQASDVHWLSHERSVINLWKCLLPSALNERLQNDMMLKHWD